MTLNLYNDNIGAEGAKVIGKAIEVSKTMTKLDLSYNSIGPEGAKAIGKAIEESKTMRILDQYRGHRGTSAG